MFGKRTRSALTQTERLGNALRDNRLSKRGFARLLAEVSGNSIEGERRSLYRWLSGETISDERADDLSRAFALADATYVADYFRKPPSEPSTILALNQQVAELAIEVRELAKNQRRMLDVLEHLAAAPPKRSRSGPRK